MNHYKKSKKSKGFLLLETLLTTIIVGINIGLLLTLQGNLSLTHAKALEKAEKITKMQLAHEVKFSN